MRTLTPKLNQLENNWYVIDATDQVLGRLSSTVAAILRGKHKPFFSHNLDNGDYVIIINAEKVKLTGNKLLHKTYQRYSGFPGGLKETPIRRVMEEKPEHVIQHAIKGMLPKNALGRKIYKKLKVYTGPEHPHVAQEPKVWEL